LNSKTLFFSSGYGVVFRMAAYKTQVLL